MKEELASQYCLRHPYPMYMPTCFPPFQDLFDSDVNCLMGLLFVVERRPLLCVRDGNTVWDHAEDVHFKEICIHIRPSFLAQYLYIRCLIQRASLYGKHLIMHAICQLSWKLSMEQLLYQFLVIKVHREHANNQ